MRGFANGLLMLGARVVGLALPPNTKPALFKPIRPDNRHITQEPDPSPLNP
jgi:hypothetical protein